MVPYVKIINHNHCSRKDREFWLKNSVKFFELAQRALKMKINCNRKGSFHMVCRNDAPVKISQICGKYILLHWEKYNFSQFHTDFSDFRALDKQKTSSSFMYTQKKSSSFLELKILLVGDYGYLATFLFLEMNVDLRICGTTNSPFHQQ